MLRPLINTCKDAFLTRFIAGAHLSVDEAMIKYKGRIFFLQYLPKKPIKWGIKVWVLADVDTGYVCNYDIYLGKPDGHGRETDLCSKVVLNISEPFQFTNQHFDNYYITIHLVEELLRRRTYACGTLRANRYPPIFKRKGKGKTPLKLSKPGQLRQAQKGSMLLTVWCNKRQVAVLSSNCNPNEMVSLQRKSRKHPHSKEVVIPRPIHIYNHRMGGVDLGDQMWLYYPAGRSCKKWWRFVFWFLLDVCICNAFVVEGKTIPRAHRTHLQFRIELAKQLIGGFCGRKRNSRIKRKVQLQIMLSPYRTCLDMSR